MSMTEIIRYDASMAARWDEFVRMSRNGTMLHQRGYMDYHSARFKDCSLMALPTRCGHTAASPTAHGWCRSSISMPR